ncbi:Agamous-like MADS-box protein mads3 [Orobanche minor]
MLLLGEDLGPLSVKELQNLEKQLEAALAIARQRKTQVLWFSRWMILAERERQLGDLNKQLKLKLQIEAEGQSMTTIQQEMWKWNSGITTDGNTNFTLHPTQSHHSLDCDPGPVLQIGTVSTITGFY